jgi:Cft2 family RNA processing exonuclease
MLIRRLKSPKTKTGLERTIAIKDRGTTICLDPQIFRKNTLNLVSHAHADHLPSKIEEGAIAYASEPTVAIGAHRIRKKAGFRIMKKEPAQVERFDAGHTIGSSQFLIKASKATVLYTGDFCSRKRFFLEGAETHDCDSLIIESTYGSPSYVFPPTGTLLKRARDWIEDCFSHSQKPVLVGYSFGKAQLLCAFLEELSIQYVVHPTIFQINSLLKQFGFDFKGKNIAESSSRKLILSEDVAIIAPRSLPKQYRYAERTGKTARNNRHQTYLHAHFTGWSLRQSFGRNTEVGFPLSDHADYNELLRHIEGCNPDQVYVFLYPGSRKARNFAEHIKRHTGIDAISIEERSSPQRKLSDYLAC